MRIRRLSILALCLASANAQWIGYPTPGLPRNADGKPNLSAPVTRLADGKPDLSGLWNLNNRGYGFNATADLAAEEIALWARQLSRDRRDAFGRDRPDTSCQPYGAVGILRWDSGLKIIQNPLVVVMLRADMWYRQVFLDGRPLPKDPFPAWMGYSVGHWDGDTLVVESTGYNDRSWLDLDGHPHTEALKITERFTRKTQGSMDVEVTYEDRAIYARLWTVKATATLTPDDDLIEYYCAEGETSREHISGKMSDSGVRVGGQDLTRYVGSYQETRTQGGPRTVVVSIYDGDLAVSVDGNARRGLIPSGEHAFNSYQFQVNAEGVVTGYTRVDQEVEYHGVRLVP